MMITLLAEQELIISVHCIVQIYIYIYDMNTLDDCDLFKCYVVLYNCASTRGVILELVTDASSKYFFIVLESLYYAEVVQERY